MRAFWVFIPFLVQGAVIGYDEFYYHLKRGLPKWERIGHPIDTFSLVVCLAFVRLVPFSQSTLVWYILLSLISCLLVTKDEFIHHECCPAKEQWLHALLFINHPIVLLCMGWMWSAGTLYHPFLTIQLTVVTLFCLYQLIYWNLIWEEK